METPPRFDLLQSRCSADGITRLDGYFMPCDERVKRVTDSLEDSAECQSDSDDAEADEIWGMDITSDDVFLDSAATITPVSLKNQTGICLSLSLSVVC
jgi:hypothetical protein